MTRIELLQRDPKTGCCRWRIRVPALEASILLGLPDRLEHLLTCPDQNRAIIDRLFPKSYEDAKQEVEHRRLLGESLFESRREMVDQVRRLLTGGTEPDGGLVLEMGPAEVDLWLRFVNDARLVLATELGIEQNLSQSGFDWGDPEAPKYALLEYLGAVEALVLDAMQHAESGRWTVDGDDGPSEADEEEGSNHSP